MCGSDGLNYGNQCEMQQAACRANMSIVEVDASNCDNGKATFHVPTASVVNSCKGLYRVLANFGPPKLLSNFWEIVGIILKYRMFNTS